MLVNAKGSRWLTSLRRRKGSLAGSPSPQRHRVNVRARVLSVFVCVCTCVRVWLSQQRLFFFPFPFFFLPAHVHPLPTACTCSASRLHFIICVFASSQSAVCVSTVKLIPSLAHYRYFCYPTSHSWSFLIVKIFKMMIAPCTGTLLSQHKNMGTLWCVEWFQIHRVCVEKWPGPICLRFASMWSLWCEYVHHLRSHGFLLSSQDPTQESENSPFSCLSRHF